MTKEKAKHISNRLGIDYASIGQYYSSSDDSGSDTLHSDDSDSDDSNGHYSNNDTSDSNALNDSFPHDFLWSLWYLQSAPFESDS